MTTKPLFLGSHPPSSSAPPLRCRACSSANLFHQGARNARSLPRERAVRAISSTGARGTPNLFHAPPRGGRKTPNRTMVWKGLGVPHGRIVRNGDSLPLHRAVRRFSSTFSPPVEEIGRIVRSRGRDCPNRTLLWKRSGVPHDSWKKSGVPHDSRKSSGVLHDSRKSSGVLRAFTRYVIQSKDVRLPSRAKRRL